MNQRSYTLIFILLSCSIVGILVLQAYWIRNFYQQGTETFNRSVYSSLDELVTRLQERKKLQSLKMTYLIMDDDTIKTPSRHMSIQTENGLTVTNVERSDVVTRTTHKSVTSTKEKESITINGKGQNVNIMLHGKKAKIFVEPPKPPLPDTILEQNVKDLQKKEMKVLVDKMITEIRVMDTETEVPDSVSALIKRTLNNKGLFVPFEFSIQKLEGKTKKVIAQSSDFSETASSFKSDLSAHQVIPTHEFLFLQFPGKNDFVLAGMRDSILLSLFFSLLILGIFYYVLRLIRGQKKLSEIKTDFVNNMTHELKTPIATISLALDAIGNPQVKHNDEKFNEYTRILKEENQKLNNHVERVLQIALLDKKELQLVKRPEELSSLLHAALANYKLQIEEQGAVVTLELPDEKILLETDAAHLQAVFGNLIDNALKYSAGKCQLLISVKKAGQALSIHFKDNGIGIAREKQEKVFDRFYRVQSGNLHDVKGFGLGLSYVRSIVEACHGSLELRSSPGKGSEFILGFKSL